MRNNFGKWINEKANQDNKIILLVGDIGFGIFDEFQKNFPSRFINCGIAEQNMIGTAAGLAAKGFKPYVYTIIPFLLYRPFDFVRNLIFHQKLNVKLVGVGSGLAYDNLGFTHYGIEDLNLISSLPNNKIFLPYSPKSLLTILEDTYKVSHPSYIRLFKGGENELTPQKKFKNFDLIENIDNFCIITHGYMCNIAIEINDFLFSKYKKKGSIIVIKDNQFKIKNLNLKKYKKIVLLEEAVYPGIFAKIRDTLEYKNTLSMYIDVNKIDKFYKRKNLLKKLGISKEKISKFIFSL